MPGTLQSPNLVKDVYGKILFTKGDNKLYDTNTSTNADREITILAGVNEITSNLTVGGDLVVTGGRITFGNNEIINNETNEILKLQSQRIDLGNGYNLAQIYIDAGAGQDARINFAQGGSSIWGYGYDAATTKMLWNTGASLNDATDKMALDTSGNLTIKGDFTVTGNGIYGSGGQVLQFTGTNSEVKGTLDVNGGDIIIGADADNADRTITFGHSTLKSIMGIDDSADRFVINTDASFDSTILDNDFSIDASGNTYIKGDLKVTGNGIHSSGGQVLQFTDQHCAIKGTLDVNEGDITFGTASTFNISDNSSVAIQYTTASTTGFYKVSTLTGNYNIYSKMNRNSANATKAGRRFEGTLMMDANVDDCIVGGISLKGTYDGQGSTYKSFCHNYIQCLEPAVLNSATVIDAAVFEFDYDEGSHKAVDGATTKTTPGAVQAWMKININGDIHYIPAYTSKTD
tara:strand:+ start:240 stop:1619 length:1380 start_codon:yes stop_codon:yes gene_type:complete